MERRALVSGVVLGLCLAAPSVGVAQPQLKISLYRLSEQDACGPAGYQRSVSCSVRWDERRFTKLKSRLTLIKEDISVPPPDIRFDQAQLRGILAYSDVSEGLSLSNRESVLAVVQWPDRTPRDFRLNRTSSPKVAARQRPYVQPKRPYLTRYYHEPLDHLAPEKEVSWKIESGSEHYVLNFGR
jgi:hypothetical protein